MPSDFSTWRQNHVLDLFSQVIRLWLEYGDYPANRLLSTIQIPDLSVIHMPTTQAGLEIQTLNVKPHPITERFIVPMSSHYGSYLVQFFIGWDQTNKLVVSLDCFIYNINFL